MDSKEVDKVDKEKLTVQVQWISTRCHLSHSVQGEKKKQIRSTWINKFHILYVNLENDMRETICPTETHHKILSTRFHKYRPYKYIKVDKS